jgi:ubiquinone/menaquinone biosynthesis C-methylase UbiE
MENKIKEAILANIEVHSAMADYYNAIEPHFRPESIKRVDDIIHNIHNQSKFTKVLDLGCGTGFIINIVKKYASEVVGVDVTQAMMDKVDKSGNVSIELINSDTGTVVLPQNHFDLATAYTFLDHLYDMQPTFSNAYNALREGGMFYADLSPNYYFWNDVKKVDATKQYDQILQREIDAVLSKDAEIEEQFGIEKSIFQSAEYQKHIKGGLVEEELRDLLMSVGFRKVDFIYHWFIGQAQLINDDKIEKDKRFEQAEIMHNYLTKALPVSRNLFKYIGFIALK